MTSPEYRMLDCYATLGVSPYDSTETIDQTYRYIVWEHDHSDDKSEEATAKFQKVEKAYNTLAHHFGRWVYDIEVMQEYLGMHNRIFKLHKHLRREWDIKLHPTVVADPNVRAKQETMARLAQSMAGLVRELKFLPGGKGPHDYCQRQAQYLRDIIEKRDEEVISYNDVNRTLRAELMQKGLEIRAKDALLVREKKNARDAEERNARLIENLRNLVAQNVADEVSTKTPDGMSDEPIISDLNGGASLTEMFERASQAFSEPFPGHRGRRRGPPPS